LSSDGLYGICTLEKSTAQSLKGISVKIKLRDRERGKRGFAIKISGLEIHPDRQPKQKLKVFTSILLWPYQ